MQETQEMHVQSLGWEDPQEEEMVAHSYIIAWKAPWTEEPGRLQSMGSLQSQTWVTEQAHRVSFQPWIPAVIPARLSVFFLYSHWNLVDKEYGEPEILMLA